MPDTMNFHGAVPIFCVESLRASIDYYVNVLGFTVDWEYTNTIASVSRERCCIFLCQQEQGHPGTWAWVGVGDAQALFEEYQRKGAKVRNPPTNYEWAYEMQVEDLDGNVLRLGSEPKEDQPFGPWRDMRGHLWMPNRNGGGWTRVESTAGEPGATG
jgi:catechol 2,3-dioxygenase-like lactoylglutathione lyase family enzyme